MITFAAKRQGKMTEKPSWKMNKKRNSMDNSPYDVMQSRDKGTDDT